MASINLVKIGVYDVKQAATTLTVVIPDELVSSVNSVVWSGDEFLIAAVLNNLAQKILERNIAMGWYTDLETGENMVGKRNLGELMMLMVTEIAEAYEGVRKNLMDDKLTHRKMPEVEFADLLIRALDTGAANGFDIGGALVEKMEFNRTRDDHKIENRRKPNGKKT